MLELVAMGTVAWLGYSRTAELISRRFRFVDALLDPRAPLLLGLLCSLLASPLVWLLPGIGAPTALAAGLSVAAGVALGSRRFARR